MSILKLAKVYSTYILAILLSFSVLASTTAEAVSHHRAKHSRHHHKVNVKHKAHAKQHHKKRVKHRRTASSYSNYTPPHAALVMDADTGEILYQENANQRSQPASLTKIMTLLLVFEALEKGQLHLDDRLIISKYAASMAPSKLGLRPGATISVRDAMYAVITKSCNDIAVAFGERLAGSESAFAEKMTARARQIGMTQTTFTSASGLPNPRQLSTARDMARLARYVILNYPGYYRLYSTKKFVYAGQVLHNHNHLMNSYEGMDGVKSGYVQASGFNLVASAVRDNHRLIGVVFGGKTASSRNAEMARLLNTSFKLVT